MRRIRAGAWALRLAPAALFLLCAPALAVDSAGVRFVAELNAAIGKGLAGASDPRAAARAICAGIADTALDVAAMMATASAGASETMDETQREAFRRAFMKRLVRDCAAHAPDYLLGPVTLAGVRKLKSGDLVVGTRSRGADEAKILMWQVRPAEGRYLATDLLVDGRSAMGALREQSALSLEKSPGDIAALIAVIER
jgi:ABC-type transporter MlaC component